jgi:hypothetical protein
MIAGLIVFSVFVGTATHCGSDGLTELTACTDGSAGLHAGFALLVCGALLLLVGSIVSVRRDARRRKANAKQA